MDMYSQVFRHSFLFTRKVINRSISISKNSPFVFALIVLLQCNKLVSSDSNGGVSEIRQDFDGTPLARHRRDVFAVHNEDDFRSKVLQSKKPVVVAFHDQFCGPCKQLMPRLESIVRGLQGQPVDLAEVDTDELPGVAMEFGVQALPTVLGIRDGTVVDKFVGLQDDDAIKAFISNISKK